MSDSTRAGHTFLASLGKTRLRPGGKEATEWFISRAGLDPHSRVLEVACNRATTSTELAARFGCSIYAVDMDKEALHVARQRIRTAGLSDKIQLIEANATRLPFPDNCFDVVINEAMLTMYADKAKTKLVREYCRVLKPGGILLTHDIMLTDKKLSKTVDDDLQKVVKSNVSPMSRQEWKALFLNAGFDSVQTQHGAMSLMSPQGLVRDEGILGAARILFNGLKNRENRSRFLGMFRYFHAQRHRLNYIACCSQKK
ncbi:MULTISPECIES: class I SAM-dependent methyltransferase [Rahnella]|uniref:Methyltransferase domain-containing protein n=1 Tax=Rahnella laticis TaxID=2787622 RepID=A0ABS0EF04_9GAMM|nr:MULTISPECIES: class I SAM-dependent methyltransferase [Rahnella]MBF7981854.1 methyltransferase domain-containing protein [Rahnella laticis]MBF8001885.1 methyltransferase domain-containing protein [Rahnella sp. LAC-M12]